VNTDFTRENAIENIAILKIPTKSYRKRLERPETYKFVKRFFDIVLASIGMIVLSPIFLIISLAIKLESKGPIFFKHTRIGKDGKIIKIYKFRSMVNNAEDMIKEFTPEQMKEYRENYKLTNDPRITKVGKFLRKTSLDELPQLINIIKGDLSIIGPRPVVSDELKKYGTNTRKFLSVTPGLTGYWAANGRSCTSYEQRMQMELFYIDNLSLKMDIKVFFKTIEAVIKREGAI
jgi:lipopolysaccharide/colanic/teichoic acid biosynthesis glycosyltransferase